MDREGDTLAYAITNDAQPYWCRAHGSDSAGVDTWYISDIFIGNIFILHDYNGYFGIPLRAYKGYFDIKRERDIFDILI